MEDSAANRQFQRITRPEISLMLDCARATYVRAHKVPRISTEFPYWDPAAQIGKFCALVQLNTAARAKEVRDLLTA